MGLDVPSSHDTEVVLDSLVVDVVYTPRVADRIMSARAKGEGAEGGKGEAGRGKARGWTDGFPYQVQTS
jgi:hypothetical protein